MNTFIQRLATGIEERASNDDYWFHSIPCFYILSFRQLHQYSSCWMQYLHLFQNGGTIFCNGYIAFPMLNQFFCCFSSKACSNGIRNHFGHRNVAETDLGHLATVLVGTLPWVPGLAADILLQRATFPSMATLVTSVCVQENWWTLISSLRQS